MATKKTVSLTAVVLSSILLLLCTGCNLNTKLISNAPKPKAVLKSFFTNLKDGDYEDCDKYLADNVTFVVKDTSEYSFLDALVELETENIEYELIGDTKINNIKATQKVKITTLDINKMTDYMKANVNDAVYEYLVNSDEQNFDKENPDHVSGAIKQAMSDFFENRTEDDFAVSTITVNFKYQDCSWKIVADEKLISAVFGGTTEDEEESAEDSEKSEDNAEDDESAESNDDNETDKKDKSDKTKTTKTDKTVTSGGK